MLEQKRRRRQIFVATSSVGPSSTNLLTAAAVAMSNRLPILFTEEIHTLIECLIQYYNR